MRKLLFIIMAALCAEGMWALTYEKVNSVPVETYVTDMKFDAKTNTLSFTDKYQQGTLYDRKYIIYFYEWIESGSHETGIYKVTSSNNETSYVYGYPIMKTVSEIACISITDISEGGHRVEKEVDVANSKGGAYSVNISNEIARVLEKGKTKLHIVVSVRVNENGYYICPETGKGYNEGKDLNCFVNCYTGRFSYNDLYVRAPVSAAYPEKVIYGDSVRVSAMIKGTGQTTYYLQESSDQKSWRTVASGSIPGKQVRELSIQKLSTPFEEEGREVEYWYRLVLEDDKSHVTDTSNYLSFHFFYPWKDGEETRYYYPGYQFNYPLPADCEKYYVTSSLPVKQEKKANAIRFTQPACPVELKHMEPLYAVRFYNADNTIISVCMTKCGADAVAPADPTYGKYEFTGWSRDFTNVHKDMNVYARYDIGGDYYFETAFAGHKNELHPMEGFEGSETRAAIGDSLTFEASICAKFEMTLKYQIADTKDGEGNWLWGDPVLAGTFTAEEAAQSWAEAKTFRVTRAVGYDYWQEKMNLPGYAFRFVVYCQGEAIYSEPWELDVYYPITVNSQIDAWFDPSLTEQLTVFNNSGDQYSGTTVTIPARSKDTVWVSQEKGQGACLQFARVNKTDPMYAVTEGEDELGRKFFICPSETETINVSVKKCAVVFEVPGQGKEEYKKYGSSAYYVEEVNCGGSVKHMPAEPKEAGSYFTGWKSWNDSEYPDDAYLNVPAGQTVIGFTAQWEEVPEIATHKVQFVDKDGNALGSEQEVPDGGDAVPPTAPEVSGYNFAGWDKPYTCITADVTIKALYGLVDTYWTVTYYDEDGTTKLGDEQVLDNMGANGMTPTKAGKKFDQWIDKSTELPADLEHITADLNVKASFADAQHNVEFYVEGVKTYSTVVEHGAAFSSIKYPYEKPAKEMTESKVYTFTGWAPEVTVIKGDMTFEAVFDEAARQYTVVFQNWDHSELSKQQVAYDQAAVAPQTPTRNGYTFSGWDKTFDHVQTDMVITAQFKKSKTPLIVYYTVTLVAEHGSIKVTEDVDLTQVTENTVLHLTAVEEEGYQFKQWSDLVTDNPRTVTITADVTFTAEFEKKSQGMDAIESSDTIHKFVKDGALYIRFGGHVYDAQGQMMK
jgi:hypothetical protein